MIDSSMTVTNANAHMYAIKNIEIQVILDLVNHQIVNILNLMNIFVHGKLKLLNRNSPNGEDS